MPDRTMKAENSTYMMIYAYFVSKPDPVTFPNNFDIYGPILIT